MKIGVFDSGIGGKSIALTLERDYPDHEVLYVHDAEHVPYGGRSLDDIISLTDAAIQPLLAAKCDLIVLACNTATAAAIEVLRAQYPHISFVGLEPMVKPAAKMTKTGVIAVCATPATLRSQRYQALKETYTKDVRVFEPDCSSWAYMIEHDELDEASIRGVVDGVLQEGADVIVLACTHYHWIKDEIVALASPKVRVIDPSEAISRRVGVLLGTLEA